MLPIWRVLRWQGDTIILEREKIPSPDEKQALEEAMLQFSNVFAVFPEHLMYTSWRN